VLRVMDQTVGLGLGAVRAWMNSAVHAGYVAVCVAAVA
jgi:hypothetical protein